MDTITYKDSTSDEFIDKLMEAHRNMLEFDDKYELTMNQNKMKLKLKIIFKKKNDFTKKVSTKSHDKILRIETGKKADKFQKVFGRKEEGYTIDGFIDWKKVYQSYNGIDLSKFKEPLNNYHWIDTYIHTDGGYLWNTNNIKHFKIDKSA